MGCALFLGSTVVMQVFPSMTLAIDVHLLEPLIYSGNGMEMLLFCHSLLVYLCCKACKGVLNVHSRFTAGQVCFFGSMTPRDIEKSQNME